MSFNVRENRRTFTSVTRCLVSKALTPSGLKDRWTRSIRIGNGHVPLLAQRAGHTPSHDVWSARHRDLRGDGSTPHTDLQTVWSLRSSSAVPTPCPCGHRKQLETVHLSHWFTDDCRWSIITSSAKSVSFAAERDSINHVMNRKCLVRGRSLDDLTPRTPVITNVLACKKVRGRIVARDGRGR